MDYAGLSAAVSGLEGGYCLWVGAGLTRQVARGTNSPPLWSELTTELEHEAELTAQDNVDFPTRLERCAGVMGPTRFRAFLRRRYWTDLCVNVLAEADDLLEVDEEHFLPERLTAIAALGHLANPIVNFNIEWLSSVLLARPCGPFQLAVDNPAYSWRELSSRFQRRVQHPHGLADAMTVMTSSDYEAHAQSLAFGVAIHSAFGNQLAIVGMSLDDEYLQRQIEQFRQSIGTIYWFNSDFSPPLAAWAERQQITMVRVAWRDFWAEIADLPVAFDPEEAAAAWYITVDVAATEAAGGLLHRFPRAMSNLAASSPDLTRLADSATAKGKATGETGEEVLVHGKRPMTIELRLRQKLIAAEVPLPHRQKEFSPGSLGLM